MAKAVVFMNPVPSKAPQISCFKFIKVISPCFDKVSVISSSLDDNDYAQVINVRYKKQKNKILRVLNFIYFQLKVFIKAMACVKKGDYAFFWVGDKMFSPMFVCKLKKAKTYFFLYGMTSLENESKKAQTTKKGQDYLAKKADFICAESKSVLLDRNIDITQNTKILHLYVDDFNNTKKREKKVGMLCRIAQGKCVLESIGGFNKFHETHPDYSLEIVGDGILFDECKKLIKDLKADNFISMRGWMLHEELFEIMPCWELLLFPTKTEGVPNSVLECMSMSIPALSSHVGGLKDIIIDKYNGYVLENTDEDTIAMGLTQVFGSDTLSDVQTHAKETINQKFTLEKAQKNFREQMGF